MKEDNLKDRAMREFSQLNKEIEVMLMKSQSRGLDDERKPIKKGQRSLQYPGKKHIGTHHTAE